MSNTSVRTTRATRVGLGRFGIGAVALLVATAHAAPGVAQEPGGAGAQPPAGASGPPKIAVVNVDFVAVQSPAGQALQREIQGLRDQVQSGLEERQAEVRRVEQAVAQADSLSGEEKRTLEREYQDALTDLRRFQQDAQDRAQRMQAEGLAQIREEIGPILEGIMQEQGYDLVLNAQNSAIVLSSDRIDITRMVLERLRAAPAGG